MRSSCLLSHKRGKTMEKTKQEEIIHYINFKYCGQEVLEALLQEIPHSYKRIGKRLK